MLGSPSPRTCRSSASRWARRCAACCPTLTCSPSCLPPQAAPRCASPQAQAGAPLTPAPAQQFGVALTFYEDVPANEWVRTREPIAAGRCSPRLPCAPRTQHRLWPATAPVPPPVWASPPTPSTPSAPRELRREESRDAVFGPKCLCLVSHYPFFEAFGIFLTQVRPRWPAPARCCAHAFAPCARARAH